MNQVRLENWDWIPSGESCVPRCKGSSRRYDFRDYSDKIKYVPTNKISTTSIKKKGPKPKQRKTDKVTATVIFVGSIQENVRVHGRLSQAEVTKRFPSAEKFKYEYKK